MTAHRQVVSNLVIFYSFEPELVIRRAFDSILRRGSQRWFQGSGQVKRAHILDLQAKIACVSSKSVPKSHAISSNLNSPNSIWPPYLLNGMPNLSVALIANFFGWVVAQIIAKTAPIAIVAAIATAGSCQEILPWFASEDLSSSATHPPILPSKSWLAKLLAFLGLSRATSTPTTTTTTTIECDYHLCGRPAFENLWEDVFARWNFCHF